MRDFMELLAGVLVAGGVGFLAERTPVRQVVQSAGAALVGGALACVLRSALWIVRMSDSGAVGAVSFALTPALGGAMLLAIVLAVAGHCFLGWAGPFVRLPIAAHRPLALALLAGALQGFIFPMYPSPQLVL